MAFCIANIPESQVYYDPEDLRGEAGYHACEQDTQNTDSKYPAAACIHACMIRYSNTVTLNDMTLYMHNSIHMHHRVSM